MFEIWLYRLAPVKVLVMTYFHSRFFTEPGRYGFDQTGHVSAWDTVLAFVKDLKVNGFHLDLEFKSV